MKKSCSKPILIAVLALSPLTPYAADDSGDRGVSVYDKHPECLDRNEATTVNPNCIIHDGPPRRRVIGAAAQGMGAGGSPTAGASNAASGGTQASGSAAAKGTGAAR